HLSPAATQIGVAEVERAAGVPPLRDEAGDLIVEDLVLRRPFGRRRQVAHQDARDRCFRHRRAFRASGRRRSMSGTPPRGQRLRLMFMSIRISTISTSTSAVPAKRCAIAGGPAGVMAMTAWLGPGPREADRGG